MDWEQAATVFIGAFLAFIFSIVVFYLTEYVKRKKDRNDVLKNVYREIRFNLNQLDKYKQELDRFVQKVIANDLSVYHTFRFEKIQRPFMLTAFNKGILYEILTDEEINTIDTMLTFFDESTNAYLQSRLNEFKAGNITASEMLSTLQYNIDDLVRYRDFYALIQSRFPKG